MIEHHVTPFVEFVYSQHKESDHHDSGRYAHEISLEKKFTVWYVTVSLI